MKLAVHERHLKFVLEVTHGAKAPDDDTRSHPLGEVGEQAVEGFERHPSVVADRPAQHVEPLLHRKERLLGHVQRDRHDHAISQRQAPADEILVALGRGIERAGVHGDPGHGRWQKVRAVSPYRRVSSPSTA
jgi:hypothetical protein